MMKGYQTCFKLIIKHTILKKYSLKYLFIYLFICEYTVVKAECNDTHNRIFRKKNFKEERNEELGRINTFNNNNNLLPLHK